LWRHLSPQIPQKSPLKSCSSDNWAVASTSIAKSFSWRQQRVATINAHLWRHQLPQYLKLYATKNISYTTYLSKSLQKEGFSGDKVTTEHLIKISSNFFVATEKAFSSNSFVAAEKGFLVATLVATKQINYQQQLSCRYWKMTFSSEICRHKN